MTRTLGKREIWHSPILPLYDLCHSDQREESAAARHRSAADDSRFLTGLMPFRNDKNFRKVWDLSFPHSAALRPLSFRPKGGICFWPAPFCAAGDSRFLNGLTPFRNDKNFRKVLYVSFPKGSNPVSYPVQAATSLCPTREAAAAAG